MCFVSFSPSDNPITLIDYLQFTEKKSQIKENSWNLDKIKQDWYPELLNSEAHPLLSSVYFLHRQAFSQCFFVPYDSGFHVLDGFYSCQSVL